jgi:hypothetical protein
MHSHRVQLILHVFLENPCSLSIGDGEKVESVMSDEKNTFTPNAMFQMDNLEYNSIAIDRNGC